MLNSKKPRNFKSPRGSKIHRKRDTFEIGIDNVDITVSKSLESSRKDGSSDYRINEEDYDSDS